MYVVHHAHELELNIVNCIGNDIKSNSFNKSQMSRMLRMMCVQPIKLKWISNSLIFLSIYNAYKLQRSKRTNRTTVLIFKHPVHLYIV